jgi:hypothetical protein
VNTAATGDDAELDIALYVPTSRMAASAELACTAVAMGSGGHVTHFGLEERRLSVTRITARTPEDLLALDLSTALSRLRCLAMDRQEEGRSLHICSRANGSGACCAPRANGRICTGLQAARSCS